jgi:hypothetical protein
MKRIITTILGWISVGAGVLFLIVTILLFVNGKVSVAGIFIIPSAALWIAGSNLLAYGKRKDATDTTGLPKE